MIPYIRYEYKALVDSAYILREKDAVMQFRRTSHFHYNICECCNKCTKINRVYICLIAIPPRESDCGLFILFCYKLTKEKDMWGHRWKLNTIN